MSRLLQWCAVLACGLMTACSTLPRRPPPKLGPDGQWTTFDGKQMPWRVWLPKEQKPRGILITVHGLSGAASDFILLGERLSAQGYAVYAYELRGQGHETHQSQRGDISAARLWQQDLAQFHNLVRARHPRSRIVWYGESLGSLIVLHTAAKRERGAEPNAVVLATPIAGLRQQLGEVEKLLLRATSRVVPRYKLTLGDLAGVDESKMRVTSSTTHAQQMNVTPHHVSAFSLRLLREVGDMMDTSAHAAGRLHIPALVLASPHDLVSSPDQIQALFHALDTREKKLLWYSRSYHLLLHDVQRDQVVTDVKRWLDRR
jgi:acylglycerol lipase